MSGPATGQAQAGECWIAPRAGGPIRVRVRVPGSKSLTNRYFALAAIAEGRTVVREPLVARDTVLMARALEALGVKVRLGERETVLEAGPLHGASIDTGLAGTVMRFVPALAMLARGEVRIDGDAGARVRPMGPMVRAIEALGVPVEAARNDAGEPCLPIAVCGTGAVRGGVVEIDASASSQFLSALMLAAPAVAGGLDIRHAGARVPSGPHLDMTVEVLRAAGVRVDVFDAKGRPVSARTAPPDWGRAPIRRNLPVGARPQYGETSRLGTGPDREAARWLVGEGRVRLGSVTVEPDLSNAGPFLAAAMATGGETTIENWPERTTQPGAQFAKIFAAMGAHARFDAEARTLTLAGPREIGALDLDMHDVGELVPTVAAVAALAKAPSALRNIGQLRGHETDRLAALVAELERIGCGARIEGDDLHVTPPKAGRAGLHGARLRTYADHRMATFAAVLGLAVPGIAIEHIETTAKTFPQFPAMWQALAAGSEHVEPAPVGIAATEGRQ